MNILSLHLGHDGAVTIVSGDEVVVHHQLDRFNKFKNEFFPTFEVLQKIKDLKITFDKVIITSMGEINFPIWYYLKKFFNITNENILNFKQEQHHIFHAHCAKYFYQQDKDFIVYVADGDGAVQYLKHDSDFLNTLRVIENETILDENLNPLYKKYHVKKPINVFSKTIKIHPSVSFGKGYQKLVYELGLEEHSEGKAMALSSYGKLNKTIFNSLIHEDSWNINLVNDIQDSYDKKNTYNRFMLNPNIEHTAKNSPSLDFVHTFQKAFEALFLNALNKVDHKDKTILLTGGCAQNILNNSNLKNNLPNQILPDPFNGDFGISLGSAIAVSDKKIKPLKHICSGFDHDEDLSLFKKYLIRKTNSEEVANILTKEPVAIFSGKSEQGQRGLGFRSLLANPLQKDIIEKINKIKKREWYRPFACTILQEEAYKYFNISKKEHSPYMMFVYKTKDSRLKNVCSVDGYSRIQTLEKSFHPKYYGLINSFKKLTGIPLVLNTSLNLPGNVLCENYSDLLDMFKRSDLKYCYLADSNNLICLK